MLTEKNDVKALILIVASYIGALSSDELISALLATELVNITNLTDAFEALLTDGLLSLKTASSGKECVLTEKGKSILPELASLLSPGIGEQAKRKASRFYEEAVSGIKYSSVLEKAEDGYYLVCRSTGNKKTVWENRLFFDDEKSAVLAQRNFELRPQAVINAVKAAITGNVDFLM